MNRPPQHDDPAPLKYDTFAKEALGMTLKTLGHVEPQKTIAAYPQYADLWFEPHAHPPRVLHPTLHLLAHMGRKAALFEPFSTNPDRERLLDVLCKSLTLHRQLRNSASRSNSEETQHYQRAHTWVLSPGKPGTTLAAFKAEPDTELGRGFYRLPEPLACHVVVLRQLPRCDETLLLRLMGRGKTLKDAADDLAALLPDEVAMAIAGLLGRWRIIQLEQQQHVEDGMAVDHELLEHSRRVVEQRERFLKAEGMIEGVAEGTWAVLSTLFEQRLGRSLSAAEIDTLHRLSAGAGAHEQLVKIALEHTAEPLAAWLAEQGR
ncbi:MAG: hypothetical protein AAFX99_27530 [Myxococcota bacterium]